MMIVAVGALSGSAAWAGETGHATRVAMPLGAAAPAPGGFLDFCRRNPTQCERSPADARDPAAISRLASTLFWQQAFVRTSASAPSATRAMPVSAPVAGRGSYDWGRAFPATRAVTANRILQTPAATPRVTQIAATNGAMSAADFGSPAVDASATGIAFQAASASETPYMASARNPMARTFARLGVPTVDVPAPRIQTAPLLTPESALMPRGESAVSPDDLGAARAGSAQIQAENDAPVLVMSQDNWALLNRVNRMVNRRIRQTSDLANYGKADYWQAPTSNGARGDCEDYVLAKREALIEAGVPAATLSIAIVETRWGESHAVLLVAGDTGEVVLDNLSSWISRWDRVDYTWHERQAPGKVFEWVNAAA